MTTKRTPKTTRIEILRTQIERDPGQPRREFNQDALNGLAASIAADGVITPLTVIALAKNRYRLRNGERRWLAAGIAGLETVPCMVVEAGGYLATRVTQMQENSAEPMTPLEWAQASYNAYLAAQIGVLAAEQAQADPCDALLGEELTPTAQRERLEVLLVELTGDTVIAYLTGGQVRVTRKAVFERLGQPTNDFAIKRLWAPLKLAPAIQDMLAGADVSSRTLAALAAQPEEAQAEIIAQAQATAGDLNAAMRALLPTSAAALAPAQAPAPHDRQDAPDDDQGADTGASADPLALEQPDTFVPDPSLALPFKGSSAAPMHTDGPAPGRGSTPPVGHGQTWNADQVLMFEGGIEALLAVLDGTGAAQLDVDQARRLGVRWHELIARAQRVGLEALV